MPAPPSHESSSGLAAFAYGLAAASRSVFLFVVFGTYVGIGALAHDLGFSLPWALGTTLLVWAAPNQVILISALGAGMAPLAAALAVSLSGVRLLPMVVSLLPLVKTPSVRTRALIVPAHLTAISVWVEGLRLLILSDDGATPAAVARLLTEAGWGPSQLDVLEHLGGTAEATHSATAAEWGYGSCNTARA